MKQNLDFGDAPDLQIVQISTLFSADFTAFWGHYFRKNLILLIKLETLSEELWEEATLLQFFTAIHVVL